MFRPAFCCGTHAKLCGNCDFAAVNSIFPVILPITKMPARTGAFRGGQKKVQRRDAGASYERRLRNGVPRLRRRRPVAHFAADYEEGETMRGSMWLLVLSCGLMLSTSGCCGYGRCGRGCGCDSCGPCDGNCGPVYGCHQPVRQRTLATNVLPAGLAAVDVLHAARAVAAAIHAAIVATTAVAASGTSASIPCGQSAGCSVPPTGADRAPASVAAATPAIHAMAANTPAIPSIQAATAAIVPTATAAGITATTCRSRRTAKSSNKALPRPRPHPRRLRRHRAGPANRHRSTSDFEPSAIRSLGGM